MNVIKMPTADMLAKANDRFRMEVFGPAANMTVKFTRNVEAMVRNYPELYDGILGRIKNASDFCGRERRSGVIDIGMHVFFWRMKYVGQNMESRGYHGRILEVCHIGEAPQEAYVEVHAEVSPPR